MSVTSKQWQLTTESELPTKYQAEIEPFWQQHVNHGHFNGRDDVQIYYASAIHPNSRGDIVISNGRIESLLKYKEVIFDLYQNGFSVFALDHRGQGKSGRMHSDPHRGFVRHFDDYVADLDHFVRHVVKDMSQHPLNLLCHSMGSAIGAMYLTQHPNMFCKAAFCAPMFGIQPVLPPWLSRAMGHTLIGINRLLSSTPWYFPGQSGYRALSFEQNVLTRSQVRYQIFRDEYQRSPDIQLGGVTSHWLLAAVNAMQHILTNAQHITLPTMLLQAKADQVVHNISQNAVLAAMPNAHKYIYDDSEHEILMERDEIKNKALGDIMTFFTVNVP
ncbi:alpha/beta fold hydrolase [Aestuariibacter salexigens]|uniref:alpha/beta fold hydrolase n=1 Tax=Aestuariibacter salexigens TaxID=226010 RepID=UPI0004247B0C|nr:alpha/beta fold hydrolase [Aestuariibacter salexigens]